MHPLYWGGELEVKEGVRIVKLKTKLHHLDELKQKFEAGFWDQDSAPGFRYARSVQSVCGFPMLYLKYYREEKSVIDVERFIKLYDEPMYLCLDRVYKIMKKYYRGFSQESDARRTINLQWKKLREGNNE